jgi:TP901 family phage tail tape measure protein
VIDAFKIGVRFAFEGNDGAFFSRLAGEMIGFDRRILASTERVKGLKAAIASAAAALAGVQTIRVMYQFASDAEPLVAAKQMLQMTYGNTDGPAGIADMIKAASDAAVKNPSGGSYADYVNLVNEIRGQMPNADTAAQLVGYFGQFKTLMQAVNPKGDNSDTALLQVMKAIENRDRAFKTDPKTGQQVIDPKAFMAEADGAAKAILLSHGLLTANDILSLVKQGGPAIKGMDTDKFYSTITELAVIMGGAKAGTSLLSMFSQFQLGHMTPEVLNNLKAAGLIVPSDIIYDKKGKAKGLRPGGVVGADTMLTDPIGWMQMAFDHIKAEFPHDSADQQYVDFMSLFGRQTTQRAASEAVQAWAEFQNRQKLFDQQNGVVANATDANANNPLTVEAALGNAWTTFTQTFGEPLVKPLVAGLKDLTGALGGLSAWEIHNPNMTKNLEELVGGLAGIATVLGTTTFVKNIGVLGAAGNAIGSFGALAAELGLVAIATAAATKGAIALQDELHHTFPSIFTPDQLRGTAGPFGDQNPLDPDRPWWMGGKGGWWYPNGHAASTAQNPYQHSGFYYPANGGASTVQNPYQRVGYDYSENGDRPPQPIIINNVTYLDGKKIHTETARYLAKGLNTQQTGTTGLDTSMSVPHVGPAISI